MKTPLNASNSVLLPAAGHQHPASSIQHQLYSAATINHCRSNCKQITVRFRARYIIPAIDRRLWIRSRLMRMEKIPSTKNQISNKSQWPKFKIPYIKFTC